MKGLGFAGSALARVLLVACYGVLAAVAVLAVESRSLSSAPADTQAPPSPKAMDVRIVAESTFPVSEWHVAIAGKDIVPIAATESRWEGRVTAPPNAQLLVEAQSEDYFSDFGHAVHLRIEQGTKVSGQTHWGKGGVTILQKLGTEESAP